MDCLESAPCAATSASPTPSSSTWDGPPTSGNGWGKGSSAPRPNWPTAKRFTSVNGADFPQWLADRLDPIADDEQEVQKIGVEVASQLAQELLDQDPPGLHIYTLNRSASAGEVWANVGLGSSDG